MKNVPFSDHRGVTGTFHPLSKRVLSNKMIAFKGGGVLPALSRYLERKENWLLTEFIELAPMKFIDEIVCEITSLEFGIPEIRPRTT